MFAGRSQERLCRKKLLGNTGCIFSGQDRITTIRWAWPLRQISCIGPKLPTRRYCPCVPASLTLVLLNQGLRRSLLRKELFSSTTAPTTSSYTVPEWQFLIGTIRE